MYGRQPKIKLPYEKIHYQLITNSNDRYDNRFYYTKKAQL